jgi:hypothetical protein
VTPEREAEIRALAERFTSPGSKHSRIGSVLVDLLTELDDAREWEERYEELLAACGGVWPG